ncbi:MAG: TonB-dependent receptor, partial [Bacteroidota bacterium]
YSAESIDILQRNATLLPIRNTQANQHGYGLALKGQLFPHLFIRGSYEQATRIPTETEIFGDFGAILPNYTLKPESSDNWNLGLKFDKRWGQNRRVSVQVDGFLRNRENLIRLDAFGPENAIFVNEAQVDGKGIEFATNLSLIDHLNLNGGFTFQSNEIASPQLGVGSQQGAEVPNIPRLFFNIGATYRLQSLFQTENRIDLFWNYFFIDRFSINEVKDLNTANPAFVIPRQHLHNLGFTYVPGGEKWNLSFTANNVLNKALYDNFRIPRPGANFSLKLTLSI